MTINAHGNFDIEELLPAAVRTSSANGAGVDLLDYLGKAKIILQSSAGGGTTPTLDVKIQESDDNSTFEDVAGATFAQVTDAADLTAAIGLQIDPRKRYVRAVATIDGTDPEFACGVVLIGRKQVT